MKEKDDCSFWGYLLMCESVHLCSGNTKVQLLSFESCDVIGHIWLAYK